MPQLVYSVVMLLMAYSIVQVISLLIFSVMVYEFMHIHSKRVALLGDLEGSNSKVLLKGRRRMVLLYSIFLIGITSISISQLLLP